MKYTKEIIAILAIVLMIGISSCQKSGSSNPVTTSNNTSTDLANSVLVAPTNMAVQSDISEATTDSPLALIPPVPVDSFRTGCRMADLFRFRGFFMMGMALRQLNLTADQITQVKTFLAEKDTCQFLLVAQLRASELPIRDTANAHRQIIIQNLKNGSITRAEAYTELKALNDSTRAALLNNPVRKTVSDGLKACEDTFFSNVDSILDANQKTIWEAFVARYKAWRG